MASIMGNGKIQRKPKVALRIIKNWEFANYFVFRLQSCVLTRNTKSSVHACLPNTLSVEQLLSTKHKETQVEAFWLQPHTSKPCQPLTSRLAVRLIVYLKANKVVYLTSRVHQALKVVNLIVCPSHISDIK